MYLNMCNQDMSRLHFLLHFSDVKFDLVEKPFEILTKETHFVQEFFFCMKIMQVNYPIRMLLIFSSLSLSLDKIQLIYNYYMKNAHAKTT